MLSRFTHTATLFLLCLIGWTGCSPDAVEPIEIPAPGTMLVVSVEPIDEAGVDSLLPNGDFHAWYGGLPYPTGFNAPENAAISTVKRRPMSGELGTAGYTAQQYWSAFDVAEPPTARFGTTLRLEPHRDYMLSVVASASLDMVATIDAFAMDESGFVSILQGSIVAISGESAARYTGHFQTGRSGTVLLRSQASPLATLPGTVTWSSWEVQNAPTESASDTTLYHRRAWANNSLDHVRTQMALYGGTETWARDLYSLHKNLGRIYREAQENQGSAILGYDQYIFQKTELQYVRSVRDFVRTTDALSGYQPAFTALLKLDRALAKRGIELIIVPLPDRVHLYVDKIRKSASEGPPSYLPHTRLIAALLEHGAVALDMAPLLRHRRSENVPVYWRADYDVPSYTLGEVANYVAPLLTALKPSSGPITTYTLTPQEIPLNQRAKAALPLGQQATIASETRTLMTVRDQDGKPFAPQKNSPVLVVGSMARKYEEHGASLAAQLSNALGFPVSVLGKALEDQEVPMSLIEANLPELESTKAVVYCFPEYALMRPGW